MKNKPYNVDKGKYIRASEHLTRAPRMEGKVQNARKGSKRGKK